MWCSTKLSSFPDSSLERRGHFSCSHLHQRGDRWDQLISSPGLTALGKRGLLNLRLGAPSRRSRRDGEPSLLETPRGLRACELPPFPPGATQSTPANFPEASTPARSSAAPQTTSSRSQLRLLPGSWRSPRVPGPRTFPHTLQPLRTSALGINLSPFQISPAPPPHHLRSSTLPPGPSGRLRLHSFSSLRIYTSQHMSDAFKVHPVPHPSAYLARALTLRSWLCRLVHTFCNLVNGERKSCNLPASTWCLPLTPFFRFGIILFSFFFLLSGQY